MRFRWLFPRLRPGSRCQPVGPARTRTSGPKKVTARLTVEALEDRCLLAAGSPAVVFLGDSITNYFQYGAGAPIWDSLIAPYNAVDYGVPGYMTQDVLAQIANGQLDGIAPQVVVLMIGVNDLAGGASPADAAAGVAADVAAIQAKLPSSEILLLGILPSGESPADPLRGEIAQTNSLISLLQGNGGNVLYVNLGALFVQPDGTLSPAVMPDYIHPSTFGYLILAEALQQPLQDLEAVGQLSHWQFVAQVYRDLLGRQATPVELTLWGAAMDQGLLNSYQVVWALENSAGYQSEVVEGLYARLLQRPASSLELASWDNFLAQGGTAE